MWTKLAAYRDLSNRTFASNFPLAILCAVSLRYLSDSFFWVVPAIAAVIEAMVKGYEIWKLKQLR